jgi:hypothetical protein
MKFQHPILRRTAGFAVATFARNWMCTLDIQTAFFDETVDAASPDFNGPAIFVFWHENILAPFYLRGHCNLAMLLSRHRDADWLAEAANFMGFESVRGSSFRGGGAALRELSRKIQKNKTNVAITPDGPRGPRRKLAQGPVFLASKLGIPIVTLGIGYDRPWRMPTWDRFALPRPFSRCRIVPSPYLPIPTNLDRDGIEHYRRRVESMLNRLNLEAEAWAQSGKGKQHQLPVRPKAAPLVQTAIAEGDIRRPLGEWSHDSCDDFLPVSAKAA